MYLRLIAYLTKFVTFTGTMVNFFQSIVPTYVTTRDNCVEKMYSFVTRCGITEDDFYVVEYTRI